MAETRRKCATPRVRSGPPVIASTSTAVLGCPSLPTKGRTSSFPLTSTGSPLRRHTFRFSASLRQHVTFTPDVLPSTHSPVAESLRRVVQTTRIDSLGMSHPVLGIIGDPAGQDHVRLIEHNDPPELGGADAGRARAAAVAAARPQAASHDRRPGGPRRAGGARPWVPARPAAPPLAHATALP